MSIQNPLVRVEGGVGAPKKDKSHDRTSGASVCYQYSQKELDTIKAIMGVQNCDVNEAIKRMRIGHIEEPQGNWLDGDGNVVARGGEEPRHVRMHVRSKKKPLNVDQFIAKCQCGCEGDWTEHTMRAGESGRDPRVVVR